MTMAYPQTPPAYTLSLWPEALRALVQPYARGMYMVASSGREDVGHLVDFEGFDGEPVYCSCEAFTIGKLRPCKHIRLAYARINTKV